MNELKIDQLLLNTLNNEEDISNESFEYQSIFLSSVKPDPTNGRFLPSIIINDEHAKQFCSRKLTKKQLINLYHAENIVLIGKSCIINCFKYGTDDWKKANNSIESIVELGGNISVSEVIQVPTIYPIENNQFQILTGHRRFFALIYVKGNNSTAQFKVYDKKPILTKVKQFQENASREELPQYGKLQAFSNAISEIESLNEARKRIGLKKLTVKEIAATLGISMGAFDNYNVLTRYVSVQDAYESGLTLPFLRVKRVVLETEFEYKERHNKTVLNINDKNNISDLIHDILLHGSTKTVKNRTFKIKPIKSLGALKKLLTLNVLELNIGIDWDGIDWEDHKSVSDALNKVSDFLNTKT